MNENNELLMYIYQNANMGVKNCTNLIRILQGKDNKIKKIVEDSAIELGASSIKDMGKVMALVRPKTVGKADGKLINQVVADICK